MRAHARDYAGLVLAALLPMSATASGGASEPAPGIVAGERFRVDAEIRARADSEDDRFVLTAAASVVPDAPSHEGRFRLKAVNVPSAGCEPFSIRVFADGFEGA
jgi:hypothetical protein